MNIKSLKVFLLLFGIALFFIVFVFSDNNNELIQQAEAGQVQREPLHPPNEEFIKMKKNEPPDVLTSQEIVDLYSNFDYKHRGLSAAAFVEATQKPNTIILDLRAIDRYQRGHIKGAVHLGTDVTIEKLRQLAPDYNSTILVYCSNSLELTRMVSLTHTIAPQIYGLGYKNIYFLDAAWSDKSVVIPWEGKIMK